MMNPGPHRRSGGPAHRRLAAALLTAGWLAGAGLGAESSRATLDAALAALPRLESTADTASVAPIDVALAAAASDAALRKRLEKQLIAVLNGPATAAAEIYACRALGDLGATAAVKPLVAVLSAPDPACADAAARALGAVGTEDAAKALFAARGQATLNLRSTIDEALLRAGQTLLKAGKIKPARNVFEPLFREHPSGPVGLGAFDGLIACATPKAAPALILQALASDDAALRAAAGRQAAKLPPAADPTVESFFSAALSQLAPPGQLVVLDALNGRPDAPTARGQVLKLLGGPNPELHAAALRALASAGEPDDLSLLARLASSRNPADADAARQTLAAFHGTNANAAIAESLKTAVPAARAELLRALAARAAVDQAAAAARYLDDANPDVSRAAIEALGVIGGEAQLSALLGIAGSVNDQGRHALALRSYAAIVGKMPATVEVRKQKLEAARPLATTAEEQQIISDALASLVAAK